MSVHCKAGGDSQDEDRFGRMFRLPPSYVPADVLADIGKSGDRIDDGGKRCPTSTVPVGHVFFGQFVNHDITLDASSSFDRVNLPRETPNVRTPTLDLDCVYGLGPEAQPYLYEKTGNRKGVALLTGKDQPSKTGSDEQTAQENDLLRNHQGTAIIGDHRNDENRIVSQLQLGMIKFHNRIVHYYQTDKEKMRLNLKGGELFEEARRITTWHYQWSVVNDFLVTMCGRPMVTDILANGRQFYCPPVPQIPIEFAVAAYRFGHSMVPMKIRVQRGGKEFDLFSEDGLGKGFRPVPGPHAIVDWRELFSLGNNKNVQRAEKLDTKMASSLLDLDCDIIGSGEKSLATRNLLRGNSFQLPGGDNVAAHMGRPKDEIDKVMAKIAEVSEQRIAKGAPLWLYVLAEAEEIGRETEFGKRDPGEGLRPVGARIVAEVLIGILELDERSYLGAERNWKPEKKRDTFGKMMLAVNSDLFDHSGG